MIRKSNYYDEHTIGYNVENKGKTVAASQSNQHYDHIHLHTASCASIDQIQLPVHHAPCTQDSSMVVVAVSWPHWLANFKTKVLRLELQGTDITIA